MTPGLYETYINLGIDPEKDLIEIAPTVHFFMGGVDIDNNWESTIPGLFGAGEVTGGMHGGNRLSQNALAEILVAGHMSGVNAAKYSLKHKSPGLDPKIAEIDLNIIEEMLNREKGSSPTSIRRELREVMTKEVGVFRTEESLNRALEKVEELEKRQVKISYKSKYMNKEVLEAIENKNLFVTAKSIILSAIERRESRGAHFRNDYPEMDNLDHMFNIILNKKKDEIILDKKTVNLGKIVMGGEI